MDKMLKKRARNGFTLVELLVVLAVTVILAAVAIPVYAAYTDKAKERVCFTNRTQAYRIMVYDLMLEGGEPQNAGIPKDCICPAGGVLSVQRNGSLMGFSIVCTKHGDLAIPERIYTDFKSLIEQWSAVSGGQWGTNDNYRAFLYDKNGGAWPTLTLDGEDDPYYIQPYIDSHAAGASNDIYIFANKNSSAKGNWNANFIYDQEEGVWYTSPKGKTIGIANQSWSWVKAKMEEQGWVEVKSGTYVEGGY